ncbi:uncharacterized protein [Cardiocondyla obscurior]|uniref:uncharacterized protein n=1 Tax=Cardiocondyla obscurior TaxID=286306 RepID=UPI0039657539
MSSLKQKYGESATTYGLRVQKTAMELYEAMTDEEEMNSEQKRTVLKLIQRQALHYFHMGLTDDIKTMVRSQHFETLKDAIEGAVEEEKIRITKYKGTYEKTRTNETHEKPRSSSITCNKCGKAGHIARECRSSKHINGFNLPRAETRARINNTEKFCTHCRKPGHTRDECWSMNGRPDTRWQRKDNRQTIRTRQSPAINIARTSRNRKETSRSKESGSESEEERQRPRVIRAAREYQVANIATKEVSNGLKLITLDVEQAKKGRLNLLVDSGATITLIKVGNLKEDTPIIEEKMALTGVTGHKINTIGKIRATIKIGRKNIKQKMYVVRDDFPIEYEGILGIDFLTKQRASCLHGKEQIVIDGVKFKLHPYEKYTTPAAKQYSEQLQVRIK